LDKVDSELKLNLLLLAEAFKVKEKIISSSEAELNKDNESILTYIDAFVIK
jgi:hypothetical protein